MVPPKVEHPLPKVTQPAETDPLTAAVHPAAHTRAARAELNPAATDP